MFPVKLRVNSFPERFQIAVNVHVDDISSTAELFVTKLDAVVAFSSLARIFGECSTIHSPPALFFF